MLIFLMIGGCSKPSNEPSFCRADTEWIQNPSMPTEIKETETFCDFYQFSWQAFLAQMSPSDIKGERVFETNRVYDPNIEKYQCMMDLVGKKTFLKANSLIQTMEIASGDDDLLINEI